MDAHGRGEPDPFVHRGLVEAPEDGLAVREVLRDHLELILLLQEDLRSIFLAAADVVELLLLLLSLLLTRGPWSP